MTDHIGGIGQIGQCGDDDAVMVLFGLDFGVTTHHDAAAAGEESVLHPAIAVDDAAGGEVGSLDGLHQLLNGDVVVIDVGADAVAHLAEVVGRHVGGHTDGDAGGTVDEQVRDLGGQHGGLRDGVVEVEGHIDGILLNVGDHLLRGAAQAGLGVTHGGRTVAIHGTEVTLTVHEGITQGPRLGHTHEGVIDGRVAVRVVLTEHLTDDTGALTIGAALGDVHVPHGVYDAALHGLETVAHVGQGAGDDDRHRIVDVGRLHQVFNVIRYYFLV